jgi:asparagine synthase (glutamine-hydrolysing)
VDSSAVVAAMSQLTKEPVRTFTIGFKESRFDESDIAAKVAQHLGCRHTVRRLEPVAAADILERLAPVFDEPFADNSAIPTWHVAQLARQEVTVALSGDGGDELFAGYRRHWSEAMLQRFKRLPGADLALAAAQHAPSLPLPWWRRERARLAKVAADSSLGSTTHRFLAKQCTASDAERHALYSPGFSAQVSKGGSVARWASELFPATMPSDPVDCLLLADTTVWLPDDMLVKVDRASMVHSLEVRVPLLSHRFVEWTATIPRGLKLRGRTGKVLLRRAIAGWLPPGILDRPKQGFAVPLSAWMVGDFGRHVRTVWHESGVASAGIFKPDCLDTLLAEHRGGNADHGQRLYGLMMFAYWWRHRLRTTAHD